MAETRRTRYTLHVVSTCFLLTRSNVLKSVETSLRIQSNSGLSHINHLLQRHKCQDSPFVQAAVYAFLAGVILTTWDTLAMVSVNIASLFTKVLLA